MVHACSSTTYPWSHYKIYADIVYPFYQQNPCKLRFSLRPYVGCAALAPAPYHAAACLAAKHAEVALCSRLVARRALFWACDGVCGRWGSGLPHALLPIRTSLLKSCNSGNLRAHMQGGAQSAIMARQHGPASGQQASFWCHADCVSIVQV